MRDAKNVAKYGILTALALILSFVESQIPAFFALPGMKLGLTNIVVVVTLYMMGAVPALVINIVRILLTALLFGTPVSLIYSISGGVLSFLAMYILYRTDRFRPVTVSIAGGVFHNVGQIIAAMVMLYTASIGYYLLVLWFSGMITGAVIGIIGSELIKRLPMQ